MHFEETGDVEWIFREHFSEKERSLKLTLFPFVFKFVLSFNLALTEYKREIIAAASPVSNLMMNSINMPITQAMLKVWSEIGSLK